jgi:tetratricopeptide (TPR) repeat protein
VDAKADTAARSRYHIAGLPTVVLLEATGAEIDRTLGFYTADDFITTVEGYRKGIGTLQSMIAEEPSKKSDAKFLYKLGEKLFSHGRVEDADARYAAVVALDPKNASGDADDALIARVSVSRKAKDWAGCVGYCRDLLGRWPASDLADDAAIGIAYYSEQGGMKKEALDAYAEYLEHWPEGEDAEFAKEQIKELKAPEKAY